MKIALTGGYGCGKSTVLKLFADLGLRTIQTDQIGHSILQSDPIVRHKVQERWSNSILNDEGSICRKKIADIVFSDSKQLRWLEQLLHPKIMRNCEELMQIDPRLSYLVEVPLLFEKRLENSNKARKALDQFRPGKIGQDWKDLFGKPKNNNPIKENIPKLPKFDLTAYHL